MKKNILLYSLITTMLFIGCKKDDGFLPKKITLDRVPLIQITKDPATVNDLIIPNSLASFVGKINLKPLYASDKLPEKVDLVVIKNGDKSNVKVLKAGVTVPSEVTFTGTELATLFGGIVTCDAFTVGVDIYANGKKYEHWPASGIAVGNGGATDANQPGYSVQLNYSTKIQYNPDIYSGKFAVVSDGWADYAPNDTLTLYKIDATHFSFLYNPSPQNPKGSLLNAKQIIVTVDPVTLGATVASQNAGSGWTYDNSVPVTVSTTASANSNFVLAVCTKTAARVSLNLRWNQGAGTYSNNVLVIKGL